MSDITTGYAFTDGEKGITAQKENDQVNQAVINPAFYSAKPLASSVANTDQMLVLNTANAYVRAPFSAVSNSVAGLLPVADNTTNGMLRLVSGNTTDYVDGTNHCRDLVSSVLTTNCITTSMIANGQVTAVKLASGVAVANLGYTPLNKAGDSLTNGGMLIASADTPSDATGYGNAALQARAVSNGGFGAIGFICPGYFGFAFGAWHGGIYVATTANTFVNWSDTNGKILPSAILSTGQYVQSTPIGLSSTSYVNALLRIDNQAGGTRPGIGFTCQGVSGAYLYYDVDNKFKFIDSGGTPHTITSS